MFCDKAQYLLVMYYFPDYSTLGALCVCWVPLGIRWVPGPSLMWNSIIYTIEITVKCQCLYMNLVWS